MRESESAWLFGDIGRPLLGPNTLAFLSRTIPGFSEWTQDLNKKQVGGPARDKASTRLENQAKQLIELYDVLAHCREVEGGSLDRKAFVISQYDDYGTVKLGNLPWTKETWHVFRGFDLDGDSNLGVIEGITWHELFSATDGIAAFFDIVQMINDWLPFANDHEMLINPDAAVDESVFAYQRELVARANFNLVSQITYHDLLQRRNGWGVPSETLDEVGASMALTRERVRQIEALLVMTAGSRTRDSWKILHKLSEFPIENKFGNAIDALREEFQLNKHWDIVALRSLLEMVCGKSNADQFAKNIMPSKSENVEHQAKLKAVRDARSIIGVIKLDTISNPSGPGFLKLSEVVSLVQENYGKVNVSGNYALVSKSDNNAGVYGVVANQLHVCSPLHVDQIIVGLKKAATQRNAQDTLPDKATLIELLKQSQDFDVSSSLMVSGRKQEHEQGTIQRWLLDLIQDQDGGVISKAEVYREALTAGIKLSSLNLYITYQSTIRSAGSGLITVVGNSPTQTQIDFANRVAEAKYVPNSPVAVQSLNSEEFKIEFTFSTPFFESGTISSNELLRQLFGKGAKRIFCCPEFDAASTSNVKIKDNFLYGLAGVKDHLIYQHGFSEGDEVRLTVSKDSVHVMT